jgi:hypothetical protein
MTFVVSSKGKLKTWLLCYVRPLFQESFTHKVFILYIKTYANFGLWPQGSVNALMQVIGGDFLVLVLWCMCEWQVETLVGNMWKQLWKNYFTLQNWTKTYSSHIWQMWKVSTMCCNQRCIHCKKHEENIEDKWNKSINKQNTKWYVNIWQSKLGLKLALSKGYDKHLFKNLILPFIFRRT